MCTCPKRDMEVEEGKAAKKSGSAESAVAFGQGKIKMEVKRKGSAPDGDADREYFIKVSSNHMIWFIVQCIMNSNNHYIAMAVCWML